MATFETSLSSGRGEVVGPGWGRETVTATAIVAMTPDMMDAADDDVGLFDLPAGSVVVGASISASVLDVGAVALLIDVGDADDENRIFAGSDVGQAGTYSNDMAATAHLHKYTAKTQIRAYILTAAGTGDAGTLKVAVEYFVDPEFTTTALVATES